MTLATDVIFCVQPTPPINTLQPNFTPKKTGPPFVPTSPMCPRTGDNLSPLPTRASVSKGVSGPCNLAPIESPLAHSCTGRGPLPRVPTQLVCQGLNSCLTTHFPKNKYIPTPTPLSRNPYWVN